MEPVRAQIFSWSLAIPARARSVSERAYVITCELLMHYRKRGPWIWRCRLEIEPTAVGPWVGLYYADHKVPALVTVGPACHHCAREEERSG